MSGPETRSRLDYVVRAHAVAIAGIPSIDDELRPLSKAPIVDRIVIRANYGGIESRNK